MTRSGTDGSTSPSDVLRLRDDVRVERLGDEVAVLDAAGDAVHRLTGPAVAAVDLLLDGVEPGDVPGPLTSTMDELVAAGLVANGRSWSRRRFMKMAAVGGAAWTAASVTSFALADPAAAVTNCASGWTATPLSQMYTSNATFYTGPAGVGTGMTAMYNLLIRAWGGGGGGGGGDIDSAGGGGGGGEYRGGTISVTECTAYTVTVGAGGGGGGNPGGAGGSSSFGSLLVANGGSGGTQPGSGNGSGGAGGTGGSGGTGFNGGMGGNAGGADSYGNSGSGGGGGGAGGASSVGGNGLNGAGGNSAGGGGTGGGTAPNMGGNGGNGGNDSNSSGTTPGSPGGGGGGAEEAILGATGGMGAAGAVWVGV